MSEREDRTDNRTSARDEGGDAACWAHRVCPECGRLNEAEHPVVCENCGAEFE
ncbi:MAG: hypothetical protein ACRDWT_13990 [Jatrophihabitantaceae bacterium]